jgi:hypothetical protein
MATDKARIQELTLAYEEASQAVHARMPPPCPRRPARRCMPHFTPAPRTKTRMLPCAGTTQSRFGVVWEVYTTDSVCMGRGASGWR